MRGRTSRSSRSISSATRRSTTRPQEAIKQNKPRGLLSFFSGRGTYHEEKFPEDAERITEYYRNNGYVRANVGEPEVRVLERQRRQEDALDRAADPGRSRASATGSARSISTAIR